MIRKKSIRIFLCVLTGGLGLTAGGPAAGVELDPKQDITNSHEAAGGKNAQDGIEQRLLEKCECGVPIFSCGECRYEAGVVALDADLMKDASGSGLVGTQLVTRSEVASVLQATGEVAMNENATVHVSPRISGIIESVPVDVGARVQGGDCLLTLLSVELGKALVEYERNSKLAELSGKVFARETKLKEERIGSEQDMIDAQMSYEQHRAELKASERTLYALGLTARDLKDLSDAPDGGGIGNLRVRASLAGTVIEKHAVVGELVEAGKDLMLLSDLSSVWVWADVPSRDLAVLLDTVRQGPVPVEITVAAFPDRCFTGRLDHVGATMNEQTRTVKVRATIANRDQALRPGMFCEVAMSLANGKAEQVLAVPNAAVLTDEGASFVFKHWRDNLYLKQPVRKGRALFGKVEILAGLEPGDLIVTDGAFLLKSDILREKMGAGCAD